MDVAGIVKVKVQADTAELSRGLKKAKRDTESFAGTASQSYGKTGAAARAANADIVAYGRKGLQANKGISKSGLMAAASVKKVGGAFRSALSPITAAGAAAAAAFGAGAIIRTLANFEQSMARVKAVTGATEAEFQQLRGVAKELGATTEFSASQVAEGMRFLGQAGFEVNEVMSALPATIDLATAGSMDLATAADIASNIMSGFSIEATNLGNVIDILAAVTTRSNTNVEQLGQAMKYVAPVANKMGISVGETAAALGVLGDSGIQGSMAGTALRKALNSLIAPTDQAKEALQDMGISLKQVDPTANSIVDIVTLLAKKNMDAAQSAAIFGERAGPAMNALTENVPKLREMTEAMSNVEGEGSKLATMMRDNLGGDIANFKSSIEGLIIALGEAGLTSALQAVIRGLTGMVRFVSTAVDLFGRFAIGPISAAFSALGVNVDRVGSALGAAGGILVTLWGAARLVSIAQGIIGIASTLGGLGSALAVLKTAAVAAFTAIRVGLMAIMTGNPVGLIITALVTAGIAVYHFRDSFQPLIDVFWDVWEAAKSVFGWIADKISSIIDLIFGAADASENLGSAVEGAGGSGAGKANMQATAAQIAAQIEQAHISGVGQAVPSIEESIPNGVDKGKDALSEAIKVGAEEGGKPIAEAVEGGGANAGDILGESMKSSTNEINKSLTETTAEVANKMDTTLTGSAREVGRTMDKTADYVATRLERVIRKLGQATGGKTGGAVKAAYGGQIKGPGTGTSDSIPAMLSDGEFVINAKQTRKFGPLLKAINEDDLPGFAGGGTVSGRVQRIYGREHGLRSIKGSPEEQRQRFMDAQTAGMRWSMGASNFAKDDATQRALAEAQLKALQSGEKEFDASATRRVVSEKYSVKDAERFSSGGDDANGADRGNMDNQTTIVNLMDPNQMVNVLGTSEGSRKIVNTIKANSSEIRAVLGVR